MTPRLNAGCLITVLGASDEQRRLLTAALQERLRARDVVALTQPFCSPGAEDVTAWSSVQQRALLSLLEHSVVLSDGGLPQAAAAVIDAVPPELQAASRAQLARSALVLLCAADARATADERALDSRLRAQLLAARASFSVVHGEGATALAQAWQALCVTVDRRLDSETPSTQKDNAAWRWSCDKCSDPACEHRMFSDLVAQRGNASS